MPLPDWQRVADDKAVLVNIAGDVAAGARVAPLDADVLQRTTLHHVADIGIAFPGLALTQSGTAVNVITRQITSHEGQPGHSQGGKVVVITQLQRMPL